MGEGSVTELVFIHFQKGHCSMSYGKTSKGILTIIGSLLKKIFRGLNGLYLEFVTPYVLSLKSADGSVSRYILLLKYNYSALKYNYC